METASSIHSADARVASRARRTSRIIVRLTQEEMDLVQRATTSGVATSTWLRALAMEAAGKALGRREKSATDTNGPILAEAAGAPLRNSADVAGLVRSHITDREKEHFITVLLDAKHRLKRVELVSVGTLTASLVHPREVFRPAIREAAAAMILVHNHPSGDPTPSPEDAQLTRRLREVGDLIGIRVLDHVIVGAESHFSFVDAGQW